MPKSQSFFNLYLSSIDVGLVVIDSENIVRLVNKTFTDLVGSDEETLQNQHYRIILPQAEEPRAMLQDLVEGRRDQLETTKIWWKNPDSFIYVRGYAKDEVSEQYGPMRIVFLRDVSEEVLNWERLDFQASVLQNVSDSIIVTDREGKINYINQVATALFGRSQRELLYQSVQKLNPDIDVRAFLQEADQQPDYVRTWEWAFQTSDKQQIWVSVKLSPHFQGMAVSGVIVVLVDISEKKEYEYGLYQQREELVSLINSQTNYLIRTDLEGYFTYANPAFIQRFHQFEEIIGQFSLDTIIPEDHEKTYKMVEECLANPGKMVPIEIRKPAPDGDSYVNYWEFVAITNAQGNPTELQGVGYEITEKKKQERVLYRQREELTSLINSQTNYLIRTDLEGYFTYANPTFKKKYSFYGELVGMFSLKTIHPDDHKKTYQMVEECLANPGKMVPIEIRKPAPDGSVNTNYWEFIAITDKDGNPTEIQGVGYDITEKKRSEERVITLNQLNHLLLNISTNFINISYQELDEMIPEALQSVTEFTGFERAFVYLFNADKSLWQLSYHYRIPGTPPFSEEQQVHTADAFPWWSRQVLSGELVQIPRVDELPEEASQARKMMDYLGVKSIVTVPIVYQYEYLGYVGFSSLSGYRQWNGESINLLKLLGAIFANSLHRANQEKALEESNRQYKLLADNISDMVNRLDLQMKLNYVSPSVTSLLGWSPVDVLRTSLTDWLHPNDIPLVEEAVQGIKQHGHGRFVARMRQKKGHYIWVETYGKTFTTESDQMEIIAVTRNIQQQKLAEQEKESLLKETQAINEELNASEEELRQNLEYTQELNEQLAISERHFKGLIEKSFDAIVVYDEQGFISYASPSAVRITGYPEIVGMQGADFVVEEDLPKAEQVVEQLKAMPGEHIDFEHRIRRKDGKVIWIESVMTNQLQEEAIRGLVSNFRDITERKQVLQALEESRTSLNIAQKVSKVGSWEKDLVSGAVFRSEEFYRIFGLNPYEHLPEQVDTFQMIHPEDREVVRQRNNKVTNEFKERPISYRIIDAKGRLKFIDALNKIIRDKSGKAVKILGTLQDVTRETELARLLDETSRIAKVGGWEFDIDQNWFTWTSEIYRIHEVPLGEVISIERAFSFYHPDDVSSVREAFARLIDEGKSCEMEVRVVTAKGHLKWIRVNGEPHYIKDGKVSRVRGALQDITERKEREEKLKDYSMRLQLATASAQIGVWDLDVSSGKLVWDQRTCEQHGLSPQEFDRSFESWWNRVHPDDIEAVEQKFNAALEKQEDYQAVFRIVRADNGEIRYIQAHATIIENEATGHLSMIGVSWDITDQKENELSLIEKNEDLQKVNSELDHFVYSTSHNLRAPLTSIMGVVQILGGAKTEEERQQYIGLIDRSIHKLDETILEISDYSRNSRLDLQIVPIDFFHLIEGVKEGLSFMENASLLQYQVEVPEQLVFYSDLNRVKIIFNNLISNTVKYMKTDIPEPYLRIHISQAQKGVDILVEDNGIGIKQEHIDRIFEMFFRATNQATGSGLGLYIVKEAVNRLKGEISISSEISQGTRFDIYLPDLQ